MEIDKEYIVLQEKYRKMHHDKTNIFPKEWYFVKEYDLKKKILKECLVNNILIIYSSYYLSLRKCALK